MTKTHTPQYTNNHIDSDLISMIQENIDLYVVSSMRIYSHVKKKTHTPQYE